MRSPLQARMTLAAMLASFGVTQLPGISRNVKASSYIRVVHSGGTFNDGRNAEKRAARAAAKAERAIQVRIYRESEIGPRRAPKNNCAAMIEMLSDRRLRQVGSRG